MFDIHQDTTYGCIKGLRDGKFDVAFCGKMRDEQGIVYTPMLAQNLVIGVDSSHELAQRESVSLKDLRGYSLVSYRNESYVRAILDGLFHRAGLSVKQGFNDEISAASLVVAEKTVVAIMLNTLDDGFSEGFVSVPIEETLEPFHVIYLAHKENVSSSSAADQLIEFAGQFSEYPDGIVSLEDSIEPPEH